MPSFWRFECTLRMEIVIWHLWHYMRVQYWYVRRNPWVYYVEMTCGHQCYTRINKVLQILKCYFCRWSQSSLSSFQIALIFYRNNHQLNSVSCQIRKYALCGSGNVQLYNNVCAQINCKNNYEIKLWNM